MWGPPSGGPGPAKARLKPAPTSILQRGPSARTSRTQAGSALAARLHERRSGVQFMTNMIIYLIGTLLVVAGLAYGADRLGISNVWIIAGALVIIGIGLMGGIVKTRQKDPAQ